MPDWKMYPIHLTHVLVSLVWMIGLVAINAIEFYFAASAIKDMVWFWIMLQNVVIGTSNAYWLVKTHITPKGVEQETSPPSSKRGASL